MNISFQNIPHETPEQIVTKFLETYADTEGSPIYVPKTHNNFKYCTVMRVYQVTRPYQHPKTNTKKEEKKDKTTITENTNNTPLTTLTLPVWNRMKKQINHGNNKDSTENNNIDKIKTQTKKHTTM